MVSLNTKSYMELPKELWWAYNPDCGWVVQDRSLFVNRCWDFPEEMTFVRFSDFHEYEQGDQAWNYTEASRYLNSLSPKDAFDKRAELEAFQIQFCENQEVAA